MGGLLLNGIELGLGFVLHTEDTYLLGQWAVLETAVFVACGALAGLLGSYSARSIIILSVVLPPADTCWKG